MGKRHGLYRQSRCRPFVLLDLVLEPVDRCLEQRKRALSVTREVGHVLRTRTMLEVSMEDQMSRDDGPDREVELTAMASVSIAFLGLRLMVMSRPENVVALIAGR